MHHTGDGLAAGDVTGRWIKSSYSGPTGNCVEVALLADAEKFSMAGLVHVCDADAVDRIVTDTPLVGAAATAAEDAGITVTVA